MLNSIFESKTFSLLIFCSLLIHGNAIVLNRTILEQFYPNFLTTSTFNLEECEFTSIKLNTFVGLNKCIDLDLAYNNFTSLNESVFMGLDNLKRMYLWYNQISLIDNTTAFVGLDQLEFLELEGNQMYKNYIF